MKPGKTKELDLASRKGAKPANLGLRLPKYLVTGAVLLAILAVMACSSAEKPANGADVAPGGSGSQAAVQPDPGQAIGTGSQNPSSAPDVVAGAEQLLVYFGVVNAYEEGRLDDARELARGFLTEFRASMPLASDDADRQSVVANTLGLIAEVWRVENRLAPPGRLGGDVELLNFINATIVEARATGYQIQGPDLITDFIRDLVGVSAVGWLRAASGLVPRPELEQTYLEFQTEIQAQGFDTLDQAIVDPAPASPAEVYSGGRLVAGEDAARINTAIHYYFNGLATGDIGLLQSATGGDEAAAVGLLEALQQDIREEGADAVQRITAPKLPAEFLLLELAEEGLYGLTVEGIAIELVLPDGSLAVSTIDKNFSLRKGEGGQWTIVVPQ